MQLNACLFYLIIENKKGGGLSVESIKTLVKKAKKGDGEAFVALVKQYEDVLYNTAIRMLQNEEDAADALQETIMQAYEKLHTLRNNAFFNTWLYKILLNQCNRILNKNKNVVEFDAHLHAGQEGNMSRDLELKEALDHLNPEYKIAFTLYYIHGMNTREIGEFLNEPEGTIKSRLSRGKSLLRKEYYKFKGAIVHEN